MDLPYMLMFGTKLRYITVIFRLRAQNTQKFHLSIRSSQIKQSSSKVKSGSQEEKILIVSLKQLLLRIRLGIISVAKSVILYI